MSEETPHGQAIRIEATGAREPRSFWLLAGLSGLTAVVSASIGWNLHLPAGETFPRLVEIGVRSAHALFLSDLYFDDELSDPAATPYLAVARTAGALFSLMIAGRILVFALGARFSELVLRLRSRHDVVIGSGPAAQDYALAQPNRKVTQLAYGVSTMAGRCARLRRSGDIKAQLRRSGAYNARRVLVDEGDDADTWQTAQDVARLCPDRDVVAHIRDTWMVERLSRAEPEASLRAFSYAGGVARQVMLAHPPYLLARAMGAPRQHIVLIGFGSVGQALLREFLITSVAGDPAPMMVTVIDPAMNRLRGDFEARHPGLAAQVDIALIEGDLRKDAGAVLEQLRARRELAEICGVYVSIDDANLPLSAGLAIKDRASRMDMFRAPIFLCADRGAGLAPVRQGPGLIGAPASGEEARQQEDRGQREGLLYELRLVSFGSWGDAFDGAGLLEDVLDGQARRLHETYEDLIARTKPASAVTAKPWKQLPDDFRSSNRRAAAHIRAKADAAGFQLADWLASAPIPGRRTHELPPAAENFLLEQRDFMDRLGELEHRRWMIDRLLNGWQLGPRDNRARRHPDLRPFSELGPAALGKDDNVTITTAELIAGAMTGRRRRRR